MAPTVQQPQRLAHRARQASTVLMAPATPPPPTVLQESTVPLGRTPVAPANQVCLKLVLLLFWALNLNALNCFVF